jgi:class 3 adenylate cyclase/tetratricopeptide (TPR) repeat protein
MTCAACGFEAPEGMRFCGQCGARLAAACRACGKPNPPDFRFCGACGGALAETAAAAPSADRPSAYTPPHLAARILTERRALEGERKQVTVLFADVVGFTGLAERLDPEDVHGIMDRCFQLLAHEVHRYEGTVNQFTGDGIMALFGAPIAHENAPERALRAALGMQAAVRHLGDELARTRGLEFRMRVGVNTGSVVVGKIGDDLHMDYTAVGDTTNLAARLQTAAEPGSVLASEHTARLVTGKFVMRPVGPLTLKGKSAPVTAHEVLRAVPRAPLVASAAEGLTVLVGRAAELAALETPFGHAAAGRGQVVFVVGEAGIGKSRLIHEFRHRLGDGQVTWLEGRCVSFGRGIPFLPVIDALKGSLGIEESDDEAVIVAKVRAGLAALGGDLATVEPYVRAALAVDPGDSAVAAMDASARRFATFDALKRLVLASAARRPTVVLIEDLHWIDQASEEYLTYIVDALAGARVVLLCTYRPGYRPPFGERSYITRIALQSLSADESVSMAAAVLKAHDFPAELRALVCRKAEGNPFFIEEVTKSLLETGALLRTAAGLVLGRPVAEIAIPDTIQDVIMARIDRLGEAPKRAIQIASVIGREFAVRLLQRASDLGVNVDRLVGELRALELIYEKSGVPELAYMFKHALTHDVAYGSLLGQRRREHHRLIGLATEELYADRLPEYWETLAHHFYRAEDWPRAFAYLVKAADKALAAFANSEAVYFYAHALEAATHLEVDAMTRAALHKGKGLAHFALSEFPAAVDSLQAAIALVTFPADRARLQAALAEALLWAHEFDAALAAADEAIAVARPAGDLDVAGQALAHIALVRMVRGDLDGASASNAEADRCFTAVGNRRRTNVAAVFVGLQASWRGDYRDALAIMRPAFAALRDDNELFSLAVAYSQLTIVLGGAGEYGQALEFIAKGIGLAESIGDRVWRARLWNTRGWILNELGAFEAADEANRRCLEISLQLGSLRMTPELIGNAEANLADTALARGDLTGVEPHLEAVAAILGDRRNEWMTWRYGMHFHANAAELALARGDLGRARDCLAACLATAERTRSRRYVVRATRLLAGCHVAGGDLAGAERLLARAVHEAHALGNPPQRWHALLAHGRTLHALGRTDEAAHAWREAVVLADGVAGGAPPELGDVFRRSPLRVALGELAP